MELYIHIPFCVKKCNYCDFLSMPADDTVKQQYVQALINEIAFYGAKQKKGQLHTEDMELLKAVDEKKYGLEQHENSLIETIYFGGGTPSVLQTEQLILILQNIKSCFKLDENAEITIEINPATIDYNGLHNLHKAGFNRLSIGLQSVHNDKLQLLGRIHTYEQFLETYHNARKAGFANINIDCMSALPGQSLEEYKDSLHKVIRLNPEHISSYSLIIEEGTPFYEKYAFHPELLPDEDVDREMYHATKQILQEHGYERYEISNYAKTGFESKHNSGYWKRIPYLGVGLGASSFVNGLRTRNIIDLKTYIEMWIGYEQLFVFDERQNGLHNTVSLSVYVEAEPVSKTDAMAEYFFLGLRMSKGVSIDRFEKEFGCSAFDVYGDVFEQLVEDKLVVVDQAHDRIALTDFGMDVSNWVFEKFILDEND